NAIAAPLGLVLNQLDTLSSLEQAGEVLFDPLGGIIDLRARRIKMVNEGIFRYDPLRMLRALRLAKRYTLTIDNATGQLIQSEAALLTNVAAERIHEELYVLLSGPGALEQMHRLDEYGLFSVLLPEFSAARHMRQPFPHYWDVFEHSLQSIHFLEKLINALGAGLPFPAELTTLSTAIEDLQDIRELLHESEAQNILSLLELQAPRIKMAALLHDIGKPPTYTVDDQGAIHFYGHPQVGSPIANDIMRRLSASTADRRLAQMVAAHHMRPGQLSQEETITPRALRRYFIDLGPTGVIVALFSLADHLATLGPQPLTASWARHLSTVRLLLTRYIREQERILPPRLVRADELISRLKLSPGPLIGQLLEMIAEAQTEGRISSREEAVLLAKEYMREHVAQES
ncbi:MAG TPA: HD domain-containing protein, partial [Ktedonobacteraceae bacterium]|nr:HD domain-containing protein [Ktedonobacteraceae bacterium]